MELKYGRHSVTGKRIIEVYGNDGAFLAGIYPDDEINGINIVSQHIDKHWLDRGERQHVPAIRVSFKRE